MHHLVCCLPCRFQITILKGKTTKQQQFSSEKSFKATTNTQELSASVFELQTTQVPEYAQDQGRMASIS